MNIMSIKDYEYVAKNWEKGKLAKCPILLIDFKHLGSMINKSYLVTENDLLHSTTVKQENSISLINAIKLRWKLKVFKCPLYKFAAGQGLKLWIDPSEVKELRLKIITPNAGSKG